MSNILFSAASNIIWDQNNPNSIDTFYEGFIDELIKTGNNVVFIRTNGCIDKDFSENICTKQSEESILKKISNFIPDLIITANHSIPVKVLEITSCPVIILNTDSPFYYSGKDYITKNIERYFFAHQDISMSFLNTCITLFGGKKEQHFYVGYATAVQAEEKK